MVDRHRYDTNRDHEFTDWGVVDRLAMTFLDSIGSVPAASSSPRSPRLPLLQSLTRNDHS